MSKKTSIIRQSTLNHFGIKQPGTYVSPLHRNLIVDIKDGIKNNYMMAIVAKFGSGKSQIEHMLETEFLAENRSTRPLFIHMVSPDKKKLNIGAVIDEMVRMLEVPEPGRSVNAKTTNLIPALGDMAKNRERNVCLVIDNAHRCDLELFSEIRDLREQHFEGITPLFSVLLIGQPGRKGLDGKLMRRKEVGWRTQIYQISEKEGWWTFDMRLKYLDTVYNGALTDDARINIAAKTTVPLEMDQLVSESMESARKIRSNVVDETAIIATDKEILAGMDFSQQDLADEAKVGKSSISRFLAGEKQGEETEDKIRKAIAQLKNKQLKKAG